MSTQTVVAAAIGAGLGGLLAGPEGAKVGCALGTQIGSQENDGLAGQVARVGSSIALCGFGMQTLSKAVGVRAYQKLCRSALQDSTCLSEATKIVLLNATIVVIGLCIAAVVIKHTWRSEKEPQKLC